MTYPVGYNCQFLPAPQGSSIIEHPSLSTIYVPDTLSRI